MDVMKKACELGEAIVASDAYQRLRQAEDAVNADVEASGLLTSFQDKTMKLEDAMEEAGAEEKIRALRDECMDLEEQIRKNELLLEMMAAQSAFQELFSQINAVLKFYVTGEETSAESSCGGNCESCSAGCGHHHHH